MSNQAPPGILCKLAQSALRAVLRAVLRAIPPPAPETDARPLPPLVPPEAIAMLHPREPPAAKRFEAEPPLRGSLRDRMNKQRGVSMTPP